MALFWKKKRSAPPAPAPGRAGRPTDRARHQPWLDHGLTDGDAVACGSCAERLRVKVHSGSSVTVAHDGALVGIALICTRCGRLLCAECAREASDNPYLPKCDSCHAGVTVPMSR